MTEHLPPVSMDRWWRDHWTTYAFLHDRILNFRGQVDPTRMRCNAPLHRRLVAIKPFTGDIQDGSKYPTRLKNGETIAPHDDWSCVEDFVTAGLVTTKEVWRKGRRAGDGHVFGTHDVIVKFTPAGWALWHQLDRWIGEHQKNWSATFDPTSSQKDLTT